MPSRASRLPRGGWDLEANFAPGKTCCGRRLTKTRHPPTPSISPCLRRPDSPEDSSSKGYQCESHSKIKASPRSAQVPHSARSDQGDRFSFAGVTPQDAMNWFAQPQDVRAAPGDIVEGDTALQTGGYSRAELQFPDLTLTRVGSNALFRFIAGTRETGLRRLHAGDGGHLHRQASSDATTMRGGRKLPPFLQRGADDRPFSLKDALHW